MKIASCMVTFSVVEDGKDAAIRSDTPPDDTSQMWLDTSVEPPILKYWDGENWAKANSYDGEITGIRKEISEKNSAITETVDKISQDLSEKTTITINDEVIDVKEQTSNLTQTVNELKNQFKTSGGNNLIKDSMGVFNDVWEGTYKIDASVDVKRENIYGFAIMLQKSNLHQSIQVPKGSYTLSFLYKKHLTLANVKLYVNDVEFILSNTSFTEITHTFESVTSGTIDIRFESDTANSCTIVNLMLNQGSEKMVWSLNTNESWTDTLKMSSSGLTIDAVASAVLFNARADIIGFKNKNTNEYILEINSVGADMKEINVRDKAKIVSVLFQNINGHTSLNYVGGD